jgi:glycosyltransferase involved in cell wall biosynthesis
MTPAPALASRTPGVMTQPLSRVGLNLLYLVPGEVGGSEIHARSLIAAIRTLEPELELIAYVAPEAVDSLRAESWADGMTFTAGPVRSRSKALRVGAEITWLPVRAKRDRVQLLHSIGTTSPPLCRVPSIVTVHDLIYLHFPETFPAASRLGLRLLVPAGARRADRVIAISEATKRDLVETLGLAPDRIEIVHNGFGSDGRVEPAAEDELRDRYRLGDAPVLLTVSPALRHKNLARLIDAFAELTRDRPATLVLVGHGGLEQEALAARARERGVDDRLVFTGWIEARDLEGLYRAATLFVYPSLLEGFGMPVLEAMRRGVPVACSNVSALPEVAGDAAELFDPYDADAITAAMRRLLDDGERRAELIERGERRYPLFTWERAAEATLAVYREVVGERSSSRTTSQ